MADRRRRKLPSEGESEGETDENSSPTRPPRSSECESEGDMKESEVSEYESTSETRGVEEEEEEEEEDDDDDEYETEEEEEVDDDDDDDDDDTYDGEDEDVIIEDEIEDLLDGERQSGDGQEQPDGENVDDDEDKKNPAYVPRKGAFYEHDMRITMDNQEEEDKKPKKKLWKDSDKWLHDRFNLDQQAPKSRDEIITMYGYDIRRADKPPDGPLESNRPRGRRSQQKPRLSDFVEDRTARYVEEQNAYNSYSGMKERNYHDSEDGDYGNIRGRRGGGRRGRGGRGRYNNSQEFQDRREYVNNQNREFYRKDDQGYRGSAEREFERKDNRRFQDQDAGDFRNNRKNFESQNSRNDSEKFRNDRRGFQDNRPSRQGQNYERDHDSQQYSENRPQYNERNRTQFNDGFQNDRRDGNNYEENSSRYNQNRRGGFNNRDGQGRQNYNRDRQQFNDNRPQYNDRDRMQYNDPRPQFNEGRRSYENDRRRIDEGRRSYEREFESTRYRNDDNREQRNRDFTEERASKGRGGFGSEERGGFRGRGRGGRDRGRDRNDRGKRREERNYPPRLQRAKQFNNQNAEYSEDWNEEATVDSMTSENRPPFPLPPSVEEKKVAPVAEIVKQEDLNIVVQNQGERKSYSKDRRARYVGKTRVQDRPSNVEEYELAKMAEKDVEMQDSVETQKNVEDEVHQTEGKAMQKHDPNQQGKPKRYSSQRQRNQPDIPYQEQVEGGPNYYNPASPSFPAPPPPPPRPPMLQPAIPFPQPVAGAIPSPRVFVPPQPPQSGSVSMATQVPVMAPRYNTAGVIFSPPNAPPPTFQVQPVVPITGFPPPSQVPAAAVSLPSPIQSGANTQQEMVRGGTTYYAPDLQYAAAPQPQKRPTSGTTYYPPEMQYKGSKRSPVRRPKAAIPIINPQDVKGKKKGSDQGGNIENAPEVLEPTSPLEEPTSLEDDQSQDREEVMDESSEILIADGGQNSEMVENTDNLQQVEGSKSEPHLDDLDEDSNRVTISDADRYTICVNDDLNLDDGSDGKVDIHVHVEAENRSADSNISNQESSDKVISLENVVDNDVMVDDVMEIKTEKPEHADAQEKDTMESQVDIKSEPLDDYEEVPKGDLVNIKTEQVMEEEEVEDVKVKGEDDSLEPDDFTDAKETLDEEEKK